MNATPGSYARNRAAETAVNYRCARRIAPCGRRVTRQSRSHCGNAGAVKMSRERPRKILVINSGRRSHPSPGGLHGPARCCPQTRGRARWPVGSVVSTYNFGRRDVRHVHQHCLGAVHVEYLAAGIRPESIRRLARSIAGRLQALASIPQRVFPFGPIPLIAPFLQIGLGALRQKHLARAFEIRAGIVEGRGGVGLMFAWMRARIKTAVPFPRIGVMGFPTRSAIVPT